MASAYAQSGKLFEEMRSSNRVNVSDRRKNRFGAMAMANRQGTQTSVAKERAQPGPVLRDVGERHEVSWLNRVTPRTQPTRTIASRTIECMEDIQLSQMTDDFSSQYSYPHVNTKGSQSTLADSKRQAASLERRHVVLTVKRQ